MNRKLLSCVLVAAALSIGCGDSNGPNQEGRLRLVHVVPDVASLDVVVDGDTVATGIGYLGSMDYMQLKSGGHVLQVSETGTTTTLVDQDVTVADGADYTMLVTRTPQGPIGPLLLTDNNDTPPAGTFRVRAVHAAPSAPAGGVDVYVTDPDADITLTSPNASDITFGQVLPYVESAVGTFQIRVTATGSKDVLIDTGPLTLDDGQVRTVVAVDAVGGGQPLNFLVLDDRD